MKAFKVKMLATLVATGALAAPVTTMAAPAATRPAGAAASRPATQPAAKADAEVIREQLPSYPLDTCVVSGGKLGEMGEPYNHVYKGRLVRFCCSHCVPQFNKDPAKYLAMIDKAAASQPTRADKAAAQ